MNRNLLNKKKFSFLFIVTLMLFTSQQLFAQEAYYVVKGKIIDKNSKASLQGASVFAQNTTLGVASDAEGNFVIKLPNGGYSLIVTYTGYQTESIRINNATSQNDNLVLELNPNEKSLEEVTVTISTEVKDGWKKYGEFFTKNFIGQSAFAKQCSIKNPEALHFYFSKKRNRLKVLSKEPLNVENFALGYNLKFAIDSFTYDYNTNINLFVGYPFFEEMQGNPEQQATWKANRAIVYNGSMLDFMRNLFNQTLEKNGFELQFIVKNGDEEVPIPLQNLYGALNYSKDDSTNTVEFKPNQPEVALIYKKEKPEQLYLNTDSTIKKGFQLSTLFFSPDESIIVEQNGYYFDQTDITMNGYLGFKKVGDMLPYDYSAP